MLSSEAGKSVLANSSYTLLMRQKPAVIKQIQETFSLSNAERFALLTASVGEGILLMDDEHSEIRIVASDEEHKQITTNPDEILEQRKNKQEQTKSSKNVDLAKPIKQRSIKIRVDPEFNFYRHRLLKREDIKYLLVKGFKQIKCLDIQGSKENFLIKQRPNESIEHCFLTFNIAEYLKSSNINFELFNSVKPDIVFKVNGKDYAIEVETGKVYSKDKKKFEAKIKSLNENYGKRWAFTVTNENLSPTYNQFGKTFTRTNFLKQFRKWLKKH
jgi:hypothetical protein